MNNSEQFERTTAAIPDEHHEALRARALLGRGRCMRLVGCHMAADRNFREILEFDIDDAWNQRRRP